MSNPRRRRITCQIRKGSKRLTKRRTSAASCRVQSASCDGPIVTAERGAARTINLCRRKVTASKCREEIEQKAFRGQLWVVRRMWEHSTIKKSGPDQYWWMWRKKGKKGHKVIDNGSRRAMRNWSLSSTAGTCALRAYKCVVHTTQESQVIEKERRQAQCLDKYKSEGMLPTR